MRNLNKWAKDNKGKIEVGSYNVSFEVKGICFTVRRKESDCYTSWDGRRYGSSAGYVVNVKGERYSEEFKTQKEVIEHIEILIKKAEAKTEEIEALHETVEDVYVNQNIKGDYRIKNMTSQASVLVVKDGDVLHVKQKGQTKTFEDVNEAIQYILESLNIVTSGAEVQEVPDAAEKVIATVNGPVTVSEAAEDLRADIKEKLNVIKEHDPEFYNRKANELNEISSDKSGMTELVLLHAELSERYKEIKGSVP